MCEKNGEKTIIDIDVNPMKMDDVQVQEAFDEAFEEICGQLLGKNKSFDRITDDLNFVKNVERFGMTAEYFLDNYDVIDGTGRVSNEKITTNHEYIIEVVIIYGELQQSYNIPVTVIPAKMSEQDKLAAAVSQDVNNRSENSRYVELPSEIDGEKVTFYKKREGIISYIFLIALTIAVIVYYKRVYKPKKLLEQREKELLSDYSEIVSKLSLLMGAGMSAYNAFKKIVLDSSNKKMQHYAYKEISCCINKIATGVSEAEAYREFGKKCKLMPYIRLSNLLVQNLNRGTGNIFELLKEETINAFNERRNTAKKLGEEAGTKLLLPMGMSLAVVLVIIIYPSLIFYF